MGELYGGQSWKRPKLELRPIMSLASILLCDFEENQEGVELFSLQAVEGQKWLICTPWYD